MARNSGGTQNSRWLARIPRKMSQTYDDTMRKAEAEVHAVAHIFDNVVLDRRRGKDHLASPDHTKAVATGFDGPSRHFGLTSRLRQKMSRESRHFQRIPPKHKIPHMIPTASKIDMASREGHTEFHMNDTNDIEKSLRRDKFDSDAQLLSESEILNAQERLTRYASESEGEKKMYTEEMKS